MRKEQAILTQLEGIPESYPAVEGVTGSALTVAWQRIEYHIAFRYTPRSVEWRVLSTGCEFIPPLAPVTGIEIQVGDDAPYSPEIGPVGGYMLPCGLVTITGSVGAGPAPAVVLEAVRRYAKYIEAGSRLPIGVNRFSSGDADVSIRGDQVSPSLAMINSGAGDLLRPFRRV